MTASFRACKEYGMNSYYTFFSHFVNEYNIPEDEKGWIPKGRQDIS